MTKLVVVKIGMLLCASLIVAGCTTYAEKLERDYLKVYRNDGVSEQEAKAIARYYFFHKQRAVNDNSALSIASKTIELKEKWKFPLRSDDPTVHVGYAILVDKRSGQVTLSDARDKP